MKNFVNIIVILIAQPKLSKLEDTASVVPERARSELRPSLLQVDERLPANVNRDVLLAPHRLRGPDGRHLLNVPEVLLERVPPYTKSNHEIARFCRWPPEVVVLVGGGCGRQAQGGAVEINRARFAEVARNDDAVRLFRAARTVGR